MSVGEDGYRMIVVSPRTTSPNVTSAGITAWQAFLVRGKVRRVGMTREQSMPWLERVTGLERDRVVLGDDTPGPSPKAFGLEPTETTIAGWS